MLAIFRALLLVVAFLSINIVVLLLCIVRPFHRNNVHVAGQWYGLMSRIMGLKVIIRYPEGLDTDKSYVMIANHQNSYDIITICKAAIPGVVTIGKKSLKWIPIFGQIYWLSGNVLIDRKNTVRAMDTLAITAKKLTQKKLSIWFFPEGTRSYGKGILPFKVGAFRLATSTNTPLMLVTASNLHHKVKWNRWNNGVVLVDMEQPQQLNDSRSAKGWMAYYHDRMQQKFESLNLEVAELEKSR